MSIKLIKKNNSRKSLFINLHSSGFTLIELIVVTGILAMCMGLITMVVVSTLRGSTKSTTTSALAQSGNFALSAITDAVNSSDTITSAQCTNEAHTNITLENRMTRAQYTVACSPAVGSNPGNITITSVNTTPPTVAPQVITLLDASKVRLNSCSITCVQKNLSLVTPQVPITPDVYSRPVIQIKFSLRDLTQSTAADTKAEGNFQTSVVLRNYEP